jgi:hypothetical protein
MIIIHPGWNLRRNPSPVSVYLHLLPSLTEKRGVPNPGRGRCELRCMAKTEKKAPRRFSLILDLVTRTKPRVKNAAMGI